MTKSYQEELEEYKNQFYDNGNIDYDLLIKEMFRLSNAIKHVRMRTDASTIKLC